MQLSFVQYRLIERRLQPPRIFPDQLRQPKLHEKIKINFTKNGKKCSTPTPNKRPQAAPINKFGINIPLGTDILKKIFYHYFLIKLNRLEIF